jgi:protein deglycase
MKRVLLLIPKGAEILETASFIDVLGWASACGSEPIETVTVGLGEEVVCTFGLRLRTDRRLEEVTGDEFDALALPGGFEEYGFYEEAWSEEVGELIREFVRRGKPVASICVGALALAHCGVLAGRCATTYHLSEGRRREQLAEYGVEVLDQRIVQDGGIITSSCPATAPDVALRLVEALTSRENAEAIGTLMGYGKTP